MSSDTQATTSINPDAVYKTKRAAALVQMHPKTLTRKIRAGIIKAKGSKYRIKGSELLKLACLSAALFFAQAYRGLSPFSIGASEQTASGISA